MPHDSPCDRSLVNYGMKLLFGSLLLSSTALAADDAAILRCRAVADATSRLACYDALPLGAGQAQAQPQPGEAQRSVKPLAEQFGLEEQLLPSLSIEKIESGIPGHFEGWGPNETIRLDNGQIWQVADGSSRFYSVDNPKVTITRGALGAFYLNLAGENRTVRVRRIQ